MNRIPDFLHLAVERGALVFALAVLALASGVGHALLHDLLAEAEFGAEPGDVLDRVDRFQLEGELLGTRLVSR